jgi:hypothetical protein
MKKCMLLLRVRSLRSDLVDTNTLNCRWSDFISFTGGWQVVNFLCASPRLWSDGPGFINVDKSSLQPLLSMASDGRLLLIDSFIHDMYPVGSRMTSQTTSFVEGRCFPYLSFFAASLPNRHKQCCRRVTLGPLLEHFSANWNKKNIKKKCLLGDTCPSLTSLLQVDAE